MAACAAAARRVEAAVRGVWAVRQEGQDSDGEWPVLQGHTAGGTISALVRTVGQQAVHAWVGPVCPASPLTTCQAGVRGITHVSCSQALRLLVSLVCSVLCFAACRSSKKPPAIIDRSSSSSLDPVTTQSAVRRCLLSCWGCGVR